ncbi:ribonuclease P [Sulfolobus sp. A20]|uniref:Rpp14/Pop5 family protein n=1 Tax=Sulfolobaceae TaxID=118883 RepID=UPI00084621A0|nr:MULTISPECIES: Rpp14/Pop5 family protein [unclassified Sulfolobus]TRM74759.1 ribonuclease P [Sulfolobus sp. A20-N-F8]TRM75788.1 ribonuclease P [Sulfolobus sp. B5]TRM80204.1 ribonuclease P [Sulfolobus sp. D5]TRM85626.1 ribonuclease P [Sulfolobus sp. E3]TRM98677.1 ribonuclease P [Sulfolobus sp. F1]TRN00104.1 ribonuclease P [Sulfolobus sp. E1]
MNIWQLGLDVIIIVWLVTLTFLYISRKLLNVKIVKNKKISKSKRYIVFYVISDKNVKGIDVEKEIRKAVKELLGSIWLEIANPRVIFFREDTQEGIISTNRAGYKVVIASIPLVKEVSGTKALVVPRRTTSSLKRAKKIIGIK